jgi:gliding motility-associated-like protein
MNGIIRYSSLFFVFLYSICVTAQDILIDQGGIHVQCSGKIYDSGGASGMYGLNENHEVTICAVGDSCVELTISNLDLEYLSDFITIHDGPTTNHPVLNNFSGTNAPQICASSVNSSGCITIVFKSDGAGVKQGFEIDIDCIECDQSQIANEQDCLGAIPVCQTTYVQNQVYTGEGNYPNEINPANSQCSFNSAGEKNGVWYAFTVQSSGSLCFSITPANPNDDYDWDLFNLTNATCADIFTDPTLEVSCNHNGQPGITGANGIAGVQNEPCINVNAGEKYTLYVSRFNQTQAGYTLDFTASSANIFDNIPPTIQSIDYCGGKVITIYTDESILCSSLDAADFVFTGPGGPYSVTKVSGPFCQQGAAFDNPIQVYLDKEPQVGLFQLDLVGTITDYCGNAAAQTSITVENTMSMEFEIENFCLGDITNFNNTSAGSIATIEWDFGDGSALDNNSSTTHTYANEGFYQVKLKLTDNKGCERDSLIIINITAEPNAGFIVSPALSVFLGSAMTFTDGSTGNIIQWVWEFGDGQGVIDQSPSYTYPQPGVYTVDLYAFSGQDCFSKSSTEVEIKYELYSAVPDVFTPNSDGVNDYLTILAFGIENFTFKIFNRWGEVVYSTSDMNSGGWDGVYNGLNQPVGVYVYCLSGTNMATNAPIIETGNITLIR